MTNSSEYITEKTFKDRVRTFGCLDQFLSMAVAQITFRESLSGVAS